MSLGFYAGMDRVESRLSQNRRKNPAPLVGLAWQDRDGRPHGERTGGTNGRMAAREVPATALEEDLP